MLQRGTPLFRSSLKPFFIGRFVKRMVRRDLASVRARERVSVRPVEPSWYITEYTAAIDRARVFVSIG